MGRGRRRRKRRRRDQEKREKGAVISMQHGTSQAENFVRGRLGITPSGQKTGAIVVKGAVTAPKTTQATGSWSTPAKKKLESRPNPVNVLRFSPIAWAKYEWLRDRGPTEIGGFGLTLKEEPLYIVDFMTVGQQCTAAHVEFDDDAVAKLLDEMDRKGFTPDEVLRVWLHTHPGSSASPSGQDVDTFHNVFGGSDWAIMVILAKGGECTARLRYTNGPGAELDLKPQVDLHPPFEGVSGDDYVKWEEEYLAHVRTRSSGSTTQSGTHYPHRAGYTGYQHGYYGEGSWWNTEQNEETAGFRGTGTRVSDTTPTGSRPVSDSGSRPSARLADQSEIPPYGGLYRLATRETDEKMRLINECVEQVWQLDKNDDDTTTIITDLAWYSFGTKARVHSEIGDDIDSINDISDEAPIACGEISWRVNSDAKLVPMKITRILSSGQVVDLRSDEAVAATELFQATKAKSGTADSTAGFAPAAGEKETETVETVEVDASEESKTETEIIIPNPVSGSSGGLTKVVRICCVCNQEIDMSHDYLVRGVGEPSRGYRAHMDCVGDKTNWLIVPPRPTQRKTEIIINGQMAASSASKGNDEPGFSPAADGSDDGGSDGTGSDGTGSDGTEPVVFSVGP